MFNIRNSACINTRIMDTDVNTEWRQCFMVKRNFSGHLSWIIYVNYWGIIGRKISYSNGYGYFKLLC